MDAAIINTQLEVAQISSYEPFKIFGSSKTMYLGRKDPSTFYRMLLKFPTSIIPNHSVIAKAHLKIYVQAASHGNTSFYTPYVLSSNWDKETINWNNQPSILTSIQGETQSMRVPGFYNYNITDLVTKWYNHQLPNYGLLLKNEELIDMTYNQIVTILNTVSSPIVEITYSPLPIRFIEDIEEIDTTDTWSYSNIADVSHIKTLTCHVENLGDTEVEAKFESSPDEVHFVCDGCEGTTIPPHKIIWTTPYAFAKCGRIAVRNIHPGETSRVKIWYQAQE